MFEAIVAVVGLVTFFASSFTRADRKHWSIGMKIGVVLVVVGLLALPLSIALAPPPEPG